MTLALLISAVVLNAVAATTSVWSFLRTRRYEKRMATMELAVVRSVMEENPSHLKSILDTQERLIRTGGYLIDHKGAMKESRRLHGLE